MSFTWFHRLTGKHLRADRRERKRQNLVSLVYNVCLFVYAATRPSPSRQGAYKVKHLSVLVSWTQ